MRLLHLPFAVGRSVRGETRRDETAADVKDSSQCAGIARLYTENSSSPSVSKIRIALSPDAARASRLHGEYWFSICIRPIAGHASFRVANRREPATAADEKEGDSITLAKTKSCQPHRQPGHTRGERARESRRIEPRARRTGR